MVIHVAVLPVAQSQEYIISTVMGHNRQPLTSTQTDNSMAEAIVNKNRLKPNFTKAINVCFHWLHSRECQEQLFFLATRYIGQNSILLPGTEILSWNF